MGTIIHLQHMSKTLLYAKIFSKIDNGGFQHCFFFFFFKYRWIRRRDRSNNNNGNVVGILILGTS